MRALWVDPRYLIIIAAPKSRPLRLEDMQADIDKLITSSAFQFTDQSCMFLHTDELESEGRTVLVNVLEKGWLTRARSRAEFFRILKSSINNRFRSVLQTHRFTQKRTGIKPPPRHERKLSFESCKPNEVSLDDPNAHLQVGDLHHTSEDLAGEIDAKELADRIREHCNDFERMVFQLLIEPGGAALFHAQLDAMRGKPSAINITNWHRYVNNAEYFTYESFEKAVLRIQQITQRLLDMNPEEERYDAAVARLSEIFTLQVPKSVGPMLVRRMFTVCARDNWSRVDSEVEDLLSTIGAVAPKFNQNSMQCLGVLFQRGHKICESCGVKLSCETQARNLGLTEITLPPKLLGTKLTRTPIILPSADRPAVPPTSNIRDSQIVGYFCDSKLFKQVTHQGEVYYQPKDFPDKQKLLFCIGARSIPFRLRVCNPSASLRKRLVCVNKSYYVPEAMPVNEVIAIINEHTKDAYA